MELSGILSRSGEGYFLSISFGTLVLLKEEQDRETQEGAASDGKNGITAAVFDVLVQFVQQIGFFESKRLGTAR